MGTELLNLRFPGSLCLPYFIRNTGGGGTFLKYGKAVNLSLGCKSNSMEVNFISVPVARVMHVSMYFSVMLITVRLLVIIFIKY